MINRDLFLYHVNKLIGTPYKHQGRNRFGLDCAGLIIYASLLSEFVGYIDSNQYSKLPNGFKLLEHLDQQAIRLREKDSFENGDVLVFNVIKDPHHLGVYDNGFLIHSTQESNKVVKVNFDQRWRERHTYSYTLKEFL